MSGKRYACLRTELFSWKLTSPVPTALKPVLVDLCEISALAMDATLLPVPTVF